MFDYHLEFEIEELNAQGAQISIKGKEAKWLATIHREDDHTYVCVDSGWRATLGEALSGALGAWNQIMVPQFARGEPERSGAPQQQLDDDIPF